MFFPDRSLSREILFPSTNFLSAQSRFEDGIREVSFFLPRFVPIKHVLSERARVKPARVPARKDSSTRKNRFPGPPVVPGVLWIGLGSRTLERAGR